MGKIVLIESETIGTGDELGRVLMKNFLYSLARCETKPSLVFLLNGGVRLACNGSESIDDLFMLVEDGVPVYACGTCLDYLRLKDSLKVGGVGKMPDLVEWMMDDGGVITIA